MNDIISSHVRHSKNLLVLSLDELYKKDKYLIDKGMELSCCAKIFHYMNTIVTQVKDFKELKYYDFDMEFNKSLDGKKITKRRVNGTRPDLIIHKRGTHASNLLVIELKMNDMNIDEDIEKLKEYTSLKQIYQYHLGLQITLNFNGYSIKQVREGKLIE